MANALSFKYGEHAGTVVCTMTVTCACKAKFQTVGVTDATGNLSMDRGRARKDAGDRMFTKMAKHKCTASSKGSEWF